VERSRAPYLLTPGPLTTSARTRGAMERDWGSREPDFIALTGHVRQSLAALAGAETTHSCVLLQGSGTFAVEAAIQTLVPRGGKLLVLVNGAYGRRMVEMARRLGRDTVVLEWDETAPVDPSTVDDALDRDSAITHVAIVHCETTSGILNPLEAIADVVAHRGRKLLVDAMSSFGAMAVDARRIPFIAMMASGNKCLESVPGIAFVIAEKAALEASAGNASSISLDLHAQWQGFEKTGQWRFTPPTHVLAALGAALEQHEFGGGVDARGARYIHNCQALIAGMNRLGFAPVLEPKIQAPIIVTFHRPPRLKFETLHDGLRRRGFVIYPGKLTELDTFRIGCIGAIDQAVIDGVIAAVADVLKEIGLLAGAL
jgi:2-aminoethylphosphonate-pyruvate transaminase